MFDQYATKARIYPVVILFLPFAAVGIAYSFQFETYVHALSSLALVGALSYLFSQLGRDLGKKKEKSLWESWGGAPSIQVMRFSNDIINLHTKERCHKKLQKLCPSKKIPSKDMEKNEPAESELIYKSWNSFLIAQTRDTKKFALLFKDNISYGFRRNLWGLKPIAIIFLLSLVIANYAYWYFKFHEPNPVNFPNSFRYSTMMLLLLLLFWTFIVTKSWIRVTAFAYAERLFESADVLA